MSAQCRNGRIGGIISPASPTYRKSFDWCFEIAAYVNLRVRVFQPKTCYSRAPILLLCWTVLDSAGYEPGWLKRMVVSYREEIAALPCRLSLIERFVHHTSGDEMTESIHKVLEVLPEDKGGGSVLFAIRRSVLESLTGESLDDPDRRYPA